MSIAVQIHDNDPRGLADLIARAICDGIVLDRETEVAHLSVLVANEEREVGRRREAWQWLNSTASLDRDNDWSDV